MPEVLFQCCQYYIFIVIYFFLWDHVSFVLFLFSSDGVVCMSGHSENTYNVERDFPQLSTPALRPTQSPTQLVPGLFPGGKAANPHLPPRLKT